MLWPQAQQRARDCLCRRLAHAVSATVRHMESVVACTLLRPFSDPLYDSTSMTAVVASGNPWRAKSREVRRINHDGALRMWPIERSISRTTNVRLG